MIDKKITPWTEYLYLGLYAFLGLGMEIILINFVEPFLFNVSPGQFTRAQTIIHWIATTLIWGLFAYFITKISKKKYNFDYFTYQDKMNIKDWAFALILILFALAVSLWNWNGFKIYMEFSNLGLLGFVFQYIYYLMEAVLITLIVVFGQKAGEVKFGQSNIPWGGIMVGATWGLVHILTQGDFFAGIFGLLVGFAYGVMYLVSNKNIRVSYVLIALMFLI